MPEKNRKDSDEAIVLRLYADADGRWPRRLRWLLPTLLGIFCLIYGFFFALTAPFLIVPMLAPLAILALLIIWALPYAVNPPTRTMAALFGCFFVASIVWPNYIAIALPGLPWITMLRLFGTPMAILLLVSVSTSSHFRQTMNQVLGSSPYVWMLLCLFVAMEFLTLPFSKDVSASLNRVIVFQTYWTAIFFVSCYVFIKPGRAERWAIALCLMAVALGILALFEFADKKILWAGHIPGFLKVEDSDRYLKPAMRAATRIYRVKATFGNPLNFAEFLALTMPFMIHFIMGRYRVLVRVAAAVSAVFLVYVILLTDSRLGIVGVFISVTLYLLLWALILVRRTRGNLIAGGIVFAYPALFIAAVAATFVVRPLRVKVWGGGAQAASNASRDAQITSGIPKILANPIGHGSGQAGGLAGTTSVSGQVSIDNYYLVIALEYGLLGFFAYFGMIIAAVYYASTSALFRDAKGDRDRALLVPLAISLVAFFVIKSVFSQQDNHSLLFMMLGLVVALNYRSKVAALASGLATPPGKTA